MSRYVLAVVLVIVGCVLHGAAQEKPEEPVHLPVIDCVVEYAHGDFSYYTDNSVSVSDTISLDLNAVDKIRLDFKTTKPVRSYIPAGVFRVESVSPPPDGPYYVEKPDPIYWMKLVTGGSSPRVTIYIRRLTPISKHLIRDYDITIIAETTKDTGEDGFVDGILVLKGTARESVDYRNLNRMFDSLSSFADSKKGKRN